MARRSTIFGLLWSSLNAGTSVLLPLAIFVGFARILSPVDIGLVALAVSCAEIAKTCGLPGLYEALLHHNDDRQHFHETALALLLIAGAVMFAVFCGAIFGLGLFMPNVRLHAALLCLIGLRIPADLITLQPQAWLAQGLFYRRLALRSIIGNVAAGGVGIALAMSGRPLLGLVVYQVGQSTLLLLMTVLGTDALARPVLHRSCIDAMRHEALMATGTRIIGGLNNYLDQVVVGALIGSVELGYYNLAKRAETAYITAINAFSGIMFQPIFARGVPGQRGRQIRYCLSVTTLLCAPPTALILADGHDVVSLVFGAKWLPAVPVLMALVVSGYARCLAGVHGAVLSVSHRNRQLLILVAVSSIAGLLIVIVAAPISVVACAIGLALKNIAACVSEAVVTRFELPRFDKAYACTVVIPFAVAIGGAELGKAITTQWDASPQLLWHLCAIAVVGLMALAGAAATLGLDFARIRFTHGARLA